MNLSLKLNPIGQKVIRFWTYSSVLNPLGFCILFTNYSQTKKRCLAYLFFLFFGVANWTRSRKPEHQKTRQNSQICSSLSKKLKARVRGQNTDSPLSCGKPCKARQIPGGDKKQRIKRHDYCSGSALFTYLINVKLLNNAFFNTLSFSWGILIRTLPLTSCGFRMKISFAYGEFHRVANTSLRIWRV